MRPHPHIDFPATPRQLLKANCYGFAAAMAMVWTVINLALAPLAWADHASEFLVFPDATVIYRSEDVQIHHLEQQEKSPGVDFFYTGSYHRMHLLAEFFVGTHENHSDHFERLQVGWTVQPDSNLWFGRFHNPLGYWNTQFHHGSYLQTSVSRPGIVMFDEEGGPLPSHVTGLLLEGMQDFGTGLHYSLAIGAGPELEHGGLQPLKILDPSAGSHRLSTTLRVSHVMDDVNPREIGLFLGRNVIPSNLANVKEVTQNVFGGFVDWQGTAMRISGAAFQVSNQLRHPSGALKNGSFTSAWGQVEQEIAPQWTPYARLEGSLGVDNDPYLAHFPLFIKQQALIGLRYDIMRNQSLKLEIATIELQSKDFAQATLQWNAALP